MRGGHSIADLRTIARRRLPSPIFHYLDGGSDDEVSLAHNVRAFDDVRLVPNCLVDTSSANAATRVLGRHVEWPVICSPTGASRLFHPDGELAVARAAAAAGTYYSLSNASTFSLEDVAAASYGPKMFQLYVNKDRGITRSLVERCRSAGYDALCVTVDVPVIGKRERDLRTGFSMPPRLTAQSFVSFAAHPGWLWGQWRKGPLAYANFAPRKGEKSFVKQTRRLNERIEPGVTWDDIRELAMLWDGPLAVKGVMSPDDARRAAEAGASAVILSNHGGRQLDGTAAPIDVLPRVADAVSGRLEIILDGGIRRGTHVLKAMSLGATACSVGRPYLYGLAAGGEAGVARALDILRREFIMALKLSGCPDCSHAGPHLIF